MKLEEALSKIYAPKGVSSVIAGILSGDFAPIRDQSAIGVSLEKAKAELQSANDAMSKCKSDWAYWGYAGDVAYWRCVVSLLEASLITGAENLPDVPMPNLNGVVMDVQYNLEKWGSDVLAKAQETKEIK
jgi:hypothetical protein